MAAFSFLDPRQPAFSAFIGRLGRSRFFTISVALHFIFVLTFGSVVLVQQSTPHTDFDDPGGSLVAAPPPPPSESLQPLNATAPDLNASVSALSSVNNAPALTVLTTASTAAAPFSVPNATLNQAATNSRVIGDAATAAANAALVSPKINNIPTAIARGMKQFTQSWRASNDSGSGVGKDRAFKFTAYLAKYHGGDWDSTVRLNGDGQIVNGSLPNLLYIIRKWSRSRIDAEPDAVPLDLETDALFTVKPPFIFFTGHRDFTLTAKEVANLQKYLELGGAVWGDSSLPGNRSRFDIAFRREMKRVLPDQDIAWETLPPDHPIFTNAYFPQIRTVPSGMNFYQEPVYALKHFGEVAVIYTANDYGDQWQIGLNEQGQIDVRRDENNRFVAINETIYSNREVYFRNCDVVQLNASYMFGTNIILHLLTRWEDKLRNVPTGL